MQPQAPNTLFVLPGVNRQGLVLFLGMALILANFATQPAALALVHSPPLTGAHKLPPQSPPRWQEGGIDLALQLFLLLLLLLLAGVSDAGASFSIVFLSALWLGFTLMHGPAIARQLGF